MQIRYRDSKGRFISAKKAKRLKSSKSELTHRVQRRYIGGMRYVTESLGTIKGYYDSPKKLARQLLPQKIRKPKYRPIVEEIEEIEELESPEEVEEWEEEFSTEFPELDALDELDELLADEDEWYHNE